jgi:hypothetical protein
MDTRLVTRRINSMTEAAVVTSEWNVQGTQKITPLVLVSTHTHAHT